MARNPSTEELRKAAATRAPTRRQTPGTTVSTYFATRGGETRSYGSSRNHAIPRTRCTEDLAKAMADYGNRHLLTPSDTVRTLIQAGLDAEEGA